MIDDCLIGYITCLERMRKRLLALAKEQGGNVYIGVEAGRVIDGNVYITGPDEYIPIKFLYFPKGTYLVSDTITYSFNNLSTQQTESYRCELCKNVHIIGEDRENTIIKLADNSKGFEKGSKKPVISFNKVSKEDVETTNCAQMNTLEDITIDCGKGNDGAVGVLYASSNCGRIENVTVKGDSGMYGIELDYGSEACVNRVTVEGFDYGLKCGHTSPIVFDNIDFSKNRIAAVLSKDANLNFYRVNWGDIPAFCFIKSNNGRYYVRDKNISLIGDVTGNFLYREENTLVEQSENWPVCYESEDFENWAFVDDFGAVGDGETDDTAAVQRAVNSGKEIVVFGSGKYKIEKTIKIPATVKTMDFCFAPIVPGFSVILGEVACMFDICEESDQAFTAKNFNGGEKCCGYFRVFRSSAKRTAVFRDFFLAASLYYNTVGGSEVYFDNVFTHTNHYSQDAVLHRDGYTPVFCHVIPVELHGQRVFARNLNIERADIELLNDNSEVVIDGYKVEGPGKLVSSLKGGKTQLNLFNAAWWGNKIEENCLFDIENSSALLIGGYVFCYPDQEEYSTTLRVKNEGQEYTASIEKCSKELSGKDALGRSWGRLIDKILI